MDNKEHPLISRAHPKFTEQGCQGWTMMDEFDSTGQGGLGLSPLAKSACLLSLSPSQQERMMPDAFSSCFCAARYVLCDSSARTPEEGYMGHRQVVSEWTWPSSTGTSQGLVGLVIHFVFSWG